MRNNITIPFVSLYSNHLDLTFICFICSDTFILCVVAINQLVELEIGSVISVNIYCIVLDVSMHYNVREAREEGEIVRPIRQSESV